MLFRSAENYSWVAGLIALGGLIYAGVGASSRCPSCKRWFAESKTGVTRIDARTGFQVRDVTTETKNSAGVVTARHTTQQQFRVLTETWRHDYVCIHCGHGWATSSVTSTENFHE